MWEAVHGVPQWDLCTRGRVLLPLGKSMEEEKCVFFICPSVNKTTNDSGYNSLHRLCEQEDLIVCYYILVAGYIETRYTCCQGDLGAEGCQIAKVHLEMVQLYVL